MLLVLISFIAFIALFVLGLRWGVVVIGKVLGRVVYDRHRNAEYIINTGQVPDQWTEPYYKKIDAARKKEGVDETERERRIASLDRKAKRNSIKRIDDLLRYFSRAPGVRRRSLSPGADGATGSGQGAVAEVRELAAGTAAGHAARCG